MARPAGPRCARCGGGSRPEGCGRCRRFGRPFAFRSAAALWRYVGPVRRAVLAIKFRGRRELLAGCALALARDPLTAALARGAWLVPLPARRSARRRRGFDQVQELAQRLAPRCGARLLAGALVRRRRHESAQSGASLEQRLRQARGAFRARPELVAGRRLVLLDDVLSSGATLDAAARALRVAGARDVRALVLAA